jgi:catechol 2,3-dioxygenase-like lactoylglutathione lyase family enzyme
MAADKQITGFGIHLKVIDIAASRKFYEGYLGLKSVFAYGSEEFRASITEGVATAPEKYQGVTYELPGGVNLEIADGHIAVADPAVFTEPFSSPKASAMIKVASLIPFLADKTYHTTFPVRKYYWNTIELVLRDPDGLIIILITPYTEEELTAIQKLVEVETINP